jgi:predicted ribosomally synthesized peptide with nif11-like leader
MSIEAANAVIDRLETDEDFATRLQDVGGPARAVSLLAVEGFEVTPQEMRDATLDRFGDVLTAQQLDQVSAGMSERDAIHVADAVLIGMGVAAAAAGAAV